MRGPKDYPPKGPVPCQCLWESEAGLLLTSVHRTGRAHCVGRSHFMVVQLGTLWAMKETDKLPSADFVPEKWRNRSTPEAPQDKLCVLDPSTSLERKGKMELCTRLTSSVRVNSISFCCLGNSVLSTWQPWKIDKGTWRSDKPAGLQQVQFQQGGTSHENVANNRNPEYRNLYPSAFCSLKDKKK